MAKPPLLFNPPHVGMLFRCRLVKNIIQPAGNLDFGKIVGNNNLIQAGKLSLRQVSTKYQPAFTFALNPYMSAKYVINQHHYLLLAPR